MVDNVQPRSWSASDAEGLVTRTEWIYEERIPQSLESE
jgi:hypothetical protein